MSILVCKGLTNALMCLEFGWSGSPGHFGVFGRSAEEATESAEERTRWTSWTGGTHPDDKQAECTCVVQ